MQDFLGFVRGENLSITERGQAWLAAVVRRLLPIKLFRFVLGVRAFGLTEIGTSGETCVPLAQASDGICSIPVYVESGGEGTELARSFPSLRLWDLQKASVALNHRFAGVQRGDRLYIPDRAEPPPFQAYKRGPGAYQTANIIGQANDVVFVRKFRRRRFAKELIYVGTRATYNWSHFLINFLPGIYIANNLACLPKTIPVVVPQAVLDRADSLEILNAVLEGRSVIPISEEEIINAERVLWIDPPAYDGPFAERSELRQPLVWHREVMLRYRDFLTPKCEGNSTPRKPAPKRRIYIDRPNVSRRTVRVENLRSILRDFDLELVDIEPLSLHEKRNLMSQVSHVVGPAGSGLANLVFAAPGVKVLAFTLNQAPSFDNFVPNLVALAGGTLNIFALKHDTRVDNLTSYEVPEWVLRDQLATFISST